MNKLTLITLFISINITLNAQIKALGDTIEGTLINFENPIQFLEIPSQTDNIWEIGIPSKILFNTAYSTNKAIITDSLNTYPNNNHSYFDLYVTYGSMPLYPLQMQLEFMHRFDTDTMLDGGYITISYNNGQTWGNIIEDNSGNYDINPFLDDMGSNSNVYSYTDTLFNGEKGYSGSSNGWIKTNLSWVIVPAKNIQESPEDTTIIRFNFISDNIDNSKEGWMIDDIRMYSVDLGSNILEKKESIFQLYPNPTSSFIIVKSRNINDMNISIYNITSELVKQVKLQGLETRIATTDLEKGIYIVRVGKQTKKLIIE